MPMPKPVASSSRPSAFVYSALPSASMSTLPSVFCALPQAFMTNASLTDRQAIAPAPFARISSARSTNPGRCLESHVGVNAPGTENSTTLRPLKYSSALIFCGPSFVASVSVPEGILSPTLMVMIRSSVRADDYRPQQAAGAEILHEQAGRGRRSAAASALRLQQAQGAACAEDMRAHEGRAPVAVARLERADDLEVMRSAADQILVLV